MSTIDTLMAFCPKCETMRNFDDFCFPRITKEEIDRINTMEDEQLSKDIDEENINIQYNGFYILGWCLKCIYHNDPEVNLNKYFRIPLKAMCCKCKGFKKIIEFIPYEYQIPEELKDKSPVLTMCRDTCHKEFLKSGKL